MMMMRSSAADNASSSSGADNYPVAQEMEYFVNVITLDDRTFRVETSETQTLYEFRCAVAQVTGVAPESQRLIHNGRLLFGEHQPLGLDHNAFVHLAPIANNTAGNNEGGGDEDDLDFTAGLRLNAHMSQLNGFAWLIVVYFSLVSWRLFMVILFEQEDLKQTEEEKRAYLQSVLLPNFATSLFGVVAGLYGVWTASHRHSLSAARKLKVYSLLLSLLAVFSFLSSLQYMDSNSMMAIFIIQMMFWYCIIQARITEHSFRVVHGDSAVQANAPAAPVVVASSTQQQRAENGAAVVVPVVVATVQPASAGRRDETVLV